MTLLRELVRHDSTDHPARPCRQTNWRSQPRCSCATSLLGLVQIAHEGSVEGYEPAQVRRLWSIVTYQRDLGINLAGVEVILHLVDHLSNKCITASTTWPKSSVHLLDEDDPSPPSRFP